MGRTPRGGLCLQMWSKFHQVLTIGCEYVRNCGLRSFEVTFVWRLRCKKRLSLVGHAGVPVVAGAWIMSFWSFAVF